MSWQDLEQKFRLDHALIERWQQLDAIEQELQQLAHDNAQAKTAGSSPGTHPDS